jgi:3-dehydroquinate synthase
VSDQLVVQSQSGPYTVTFKRGGLRDLDAAAGSGMHLIVDERVAALHAATLPRVLAAPSILRIAATESAKSLERFPGYVERLVANGIRRDHVIVAVGGGILQDIACFLAATLLRGLPWHFYPTTLLAQADSCIGSKSSINVGTIKNILGTFTPPTHVVIDSAVLGTLDDEAIRSGLGEMLKVHAIDGPASFDRIAADYDRIVGEPEVRAEYIYRSLEIKRRIIEADEFDRTIRRVMNYGHSFGHAIESATDFGIPHGIAVTIGMDMANYVATKLGVAPASIYERMHATLARNSAGFTGVAIPLDRLLAALSVDKKNTGRRLTLILPDRSGQIVIGQHENNEVLRAACEDYLSRRAAGGEHMTAGT